MSPRKLKKDHNGNPLPPGVQEYKTEHGWSYRVRFEQHGKHKSRSFLTVEECLDFQAELRLERRYGRSLSQPQSAVTLGQYMTETWWPDYAEIELEPRTLSAHRQVWNKWVEPYLAHEPLVAIDAEDIREWQIKVRRLGIRDESMRRSLNVLSGIYTHAQGFPRKTGVRAHPIVKGMRPRRTRKRVVRVYPPEVWEAFRRYYKEEGGQTGERDWIITAMIAYGGVRPGEALAQKAEDFRAETFIVEEGASAGDAGDTKTDQSRSVKYLAPLKEDMDSWIKANKLKGKDLIIPSAEGDVWSDSAYRNWVKRKWRPAAKRVAEILDRDRLATDRPYSGRHSFASLMIRAGYATNPKALARMLGHDVSVLLDYYLDEISEYADVKPIDASKEIIKARRKVSKMKWPKEATDS